MKISKQPIIKQNIPGPKPRSTILIVNFHCYASTPFEFSHGKSILLNMLWQAAILPHHAIHIEHTISQSQHLCFSEVCKKL
jgi:hypothetical protein